MGFIRQVMGKVAGKIVDKIQSIKDEEEQNKELKKWQDRFSRARTNYDASVMDERESIYLGTHDVDKNINSNSNPSKRANTVYNISYEFIESMCDMVIPQPSVRCKVESHKDQAQTIEDSLKNDIQELPLQRLNDHIERTTQIQGFSLLSIGWNQNADKHTYMGEITLQEIHPKQFIPQANVYILDDMDYYFIMNSQTKQYIKKRYGIDVELEAEEYPEINSIDNPGNNENNKVTEIIAWYKDEDGDIGRFVWCNNTVLENMPKYFYRRPDGQIQETETLMQDVQKATGEIIPAGTTVPYYIPKHYPLVVRPNVPKAFTFGGQSDVDVIRDLQDALKKVVSSIEEKIIRGGAVVTAQDDHNVNLTNQLYQVIKGNPQQLNMLKVLNLEADIGQDMEFAQYLYKVAQSTLGITDSFQGKADNTAKSGKAKQMMIQQAAGRMQSKQYNKVAAFQELFRLLFEFKLAFYDEERPYLRKGDNNEDQYSVFNKYDFLERDAAGEYYYNTDFLITADGADLPKDKTWIMQQTLQIYQLQAMTPSQLWQVLSDLGYPNAKEFFKQAQQREAQQQQMQQQQQQMQVQQQQAQQQAQMQQQQAQQQMQMQAQAHQQRMQPIENAMAQKQAQEQAAAQREQQAIQNARDDMKTANDNKQKELDRNHQLRMEMLKQQAKKEQIQAQQQQQQQSGQGQGQTQQQPNPVEQILSQLNPAEQQAFKNASPEQQQAIIQQIMGGNQ